MKAFEAVVQRFEPQSRLLRTWPLHGGSLGQVTALEIVQPDGRTKQMVVRRHGERDLKSNPQIAADEFKLLTLLQAQGVSVAAAYYLDMSCEIFTTPYIVIEYIEGQPQYEPEHGVNCAVQMASQLARIHCIDGLSQELSFLPRQANTFAKRLGEQRLNLDASSNEARIRNTLGAAWPLPQSNAPILLHGDFWPGNMLWRQGRLVAVIDWEDAKVGDPLEDLAISRFDICFIFGIEAMNAFTGQYQSLSNIDFRHLPYWDLYAALRAESGIAEWAEGWPALGRADLTEEAIRRTHQWFINQAFEKLSQL